MLFKLSDARYHELLRLIRTLEEDLAQLRTQHERLRGRFYGAQGSQPHPPAPPPGSREEKDAILRDFFAGRRKHDAAD